MCFLHVCSFPLFLSCKLKFRTFVKFEIKHFGILKLLILTVYFVNCVTTWDISSLNNMRTDSSPPKPSRSFSLSCFHHFLMASTQWQAPHGVRQGWLGGGDSWYFPKWQCNGMLGLRHSRRKTIPRELGHVVGWQEECVGHSDALVSRAEWPCRGAGCNQDHLLLKGRRLEPRTEVWPSEIWN